MAGRTIRSSLVALVSLWVLFTLLSGCDVLQPQEEPIATPTSTTAAPTPTTAFETPQPTEESSNLIPIVVWLPPRFDPDLNTDASLLMQERLKAFNLEHPNLAVSYRVKDDVGPAGLLGSLSSTSKVAPEAIPDLVLFSDEQLAIAIEGSLVYPYPSPLITDEESDWFEVAGEMSSYQDQSFSLPLAADGLVMIYKTSLMEEIPTTWDDLTSSGYQISFPPADPEASFTLALYLSEGGTLTDAEGGLTLDAEPLQRVLEFYAQLEDQSQLPNNPAVIETDQEAWDLFQFGGRQITVTTASRYLQQLNRELVARPLLTSSGIPATLVSGWGWALTNPDPNKQVAAAELARYLSTPEFTGPWTEAAQLLPLRSKAVDLWEDTEHREAANLLLPAAQMQPSDNITPTIRQALLDAVISVLNGELSPPEAAQNAADQFQN